MANVKLEFENYGGSTGNSSTTTAKYFNSDGIVVPNAWVTRNYVAGSSGDTVSTLYTKRTYSHFFDSSGNSLQAYVCPSSDSWMSGNISGNFSDNGTTFSNCIIKGRMPLFSCPGYSVSASKAAYLSASSTNGTSTAMWLPFFALNSACSGTIYRTNEKIDITVNYSTPVTYTFTASDFRDGVVPEVLYFILQGGGGGGGGTTQSSNGGGGGAGAIFGSLVNLYYCNGEEIHFSVGGGGTGGYKAEVNSSEQGKGTAGERTNITYYLSDEIIKELYPSTSASSWYGGTLHAGGGNPGRDAGVAGASSSRGTGGTADYTYPSYNNTSTRNTDAYITTNSGSGGNGGNEASSGSSPSFVTFKTTKTTCTARTSGTYHNNITPNVYSGGTAGDGRSGGGGGSHFGTGGNGGVSAGGQSKNHGSAGGLGAGGGGARYYFGRYNRGGNGGSGCILIFY